MQPRSITRSLFKWQFVICLSCAMPTQAYCSEVVLELTNGKRLLADRILRNSDSATITLHVERAGISIRRVLPLTAVRSVDIDGHHYSRQELRKRPDSSTSSPRAVVPASLQVDQPRDSNPVPSALAPVLPPKIEQTAPLPDASPQWASLQRIPNDCGDCVPPPLGVEGTVVGVRRDPLSAYQGILAHHFPQGVPLSEVGFALDLMRARKSDEVLGFWPPVSPKSETAPPPQTLPRPASVPPVVSRPEPVQSISAKAHPTSSDGNVDWDVLALEVCAYDLAGQPTAMRGTLRVTLWGQDQQLIRSFGSHFSARPGSPKKITTWTRAVNTKTIAGQFHNNAVNDDDPLVHRWLLPLPRPLPDHNLRLAPFGELRVQLVVPGQGTFEATQPNLVLRKASPLRNRQLVQTGSRFFNQEQTRDSRQAGGFVIQNHSTVRPNGSVLSVQP